MGNLVYEITIIETVMLGDGDDAADEHWYTIVLPTVENIKEL